MMCVLGYLYCHLFQMKECCRCPQLFHLNLFTELFPKDISHIWKICSYSICSENGEKSIWNSSSTADKLTFDVFVYQSSLFTEHCTICASHKHICMLIFTCFTLTIKGNLCSTLVFIINRQRVAQEQDTNFIQVPSTWVGIYICLFKPSQNRCTLGKSINIMAISLHVLYWKWWTKHNGMMPLIFHNKPNMCLN